MERSQVAAADSARGRWEDSTGPSLDEAGDIVAFSSRHAIDASDMGADYDLFIHRIRR